MHYYLYDAALAEAKHAGALADIETRLTDYGLQGRIGRLGPLKSASELVKSARKAGATTVVAVGSDRTVAEAVNATVSSGADFVLGAIPLFGPHQIADLLGIPVGTGAVSVLAARKIEVVDLGKVNGYYFLTSARVESEEPVALRCEERYTVTPLSPGARLTIENLAAHARCQDGYLEATIARPRRWWRPGALTSVIPLQRGTLSAAGAARVVAENVYATKLPATVEVIPKTLKVVVGRNRAF